MSEEGNGSSIFVPVVPDAPLNLYSAEVTLNSVKLVWSDGVYNGGKPISGYTLEKQTDGESEWRVISANIKQREFIVNDLVQGTDYLFRVICSNEIGDSLPSEAEQVLTAIIPERPEGVQTTVVANSIVVSWSHPSFDFVQDFGSPITQFTVLIESTEGQFFEELSNCDGSAEGVIATMECSIPISVLLGEPFHLTTSVYAKVAVSNIVGTSEFSDVGNGAYITMSYVPDPPRNFLRNEAQTTKTQLSFSWTEGASNGGQPVLDYRVSFDQASNNWRVL